MRESPARLYHWRRSTSEIFHFSGYFTTMVPGEHQCGKSDKTFDGLGNTIGAVGRGVDYLNGVY